MSAQSHIARPYAQALFGLAEEQNALADWERRLRLLATVAGDPAVQELARQPQVSWEQLADLITNIYRDISGDALGEQGGNLVKLIAKNGRLDDLGDIAEAYTIRRAAAEKIMNATVTTAVEMAADQRQQFVHSLRDQLGRAVELEFEVDAELIGGAVIRAGDRVIDGSVSAQIEQLGSAIGT